MCPGVRQAIVEAQWKDPRIRPLCDRLLTRALPPPTFGREKLTLRISDDYCLECLVPQPIGDSTWVVVVPDGEFRPEGSWKSFIYDQCHHGHFGAHHPADRTTMLIRRIAYWDALRKDIQERVDRCWVCLLYTSPSPRDRG